MSPPISLSPCPPQVEVTQKVISGVYSGVTTVELDTLAAETAAAMTTKHPDYAILAARIAVSNLHKETKKIFSGELVFLYRLTHSLLHSTHNLTQSLTPSLHPQSHSITHSPSPPVVVKDLYEYTNPLTGKHSPMVSKELLDIVNKNADVSEATTAVL